jgi:drug/metabolite transporter (DMT)-like permease
MMLVSKAAVYMLLASLLFATMNMLVKFVAHIPAVEIVLFRSVISLFICFFSLKAKNLKVLGYNYKLLISRGFVGAAALIMFFITLQNIPLAGAVSIQFLAPIFTTIIGIFYVNEKVKPVQWLFFAISFAGILMIKGFDPRISPLYLILGIVSAFFSGMAYNIIRKINTTEHPLVIVLYFPLVTLPIAGIYSVFNWVQPQGVDWIYLFMIGLLTQFAQYLMTMSYQQESLAKVSHLNYVSIIYALIYGYIFFDEIFTLPVFAGMALVILGLILNLRSNRRSAIGASKKT